LYVNGQTPFRKTDSFEQFFNGVEVREMAQITQTRMIEAKVIAAADALLTYLLEQRLGQPEDIVLHHRLVAELKLCTDKYAQLLSSPDA
jgi:hypothetical protein